MMEPLRPLDSIDWKETAALMGILALLLAPLRWFWRITKRRILIPLFTEILEAVLKPRLERLDKAAEQTGKCADALNEIVGRLETVDEDITILFSAALGIDRRSWKERRATPRVGQVDRRQRQLPIITLPNHEEGRE